jgi:ERCC4-type nuclease
VKGKPGSAQALPIERLKLPTGDYTIEGFADLVTFERKTLADLIGTLFGRSRDSNGNARAEQDRFRRELERMRQMSRRGGYARIIVEASIVDVYEHRYRSTVPPISVVNFMNSIDVDYGIPTIWAGDRNGAQLLVGTVLRRIAAQARGEGEAFRDAVRRGVAPHLPWITGEVRDAGPAVGM